MSEELMNTPQGSRSVIYHSTYESMVIKDSKQENRRWAL